MVWIQRGNSNGIEKIQALFPNTYGLPRVEYEVCENKVWRPMNIGVVLSGGQAPGRSQCDRWNL